MKTLLPAVTLLLGTLVGASSGAEPQNTKTEMADQPVIGDLREEQTPEFRAYIDKLKQKNPSLLTCNEKWMLEIEAMGELRGKGRQLRKEGKPGEAIEVFNQILAAYPDAMSTPLVYHYLAGCYRDLQDLASADEVLRQGIGAAKTIAEKAKDAAWVGGVYFLIVVLYTGIEHLDEKDIQDMRACASTSLAGVTTSPDLLNVRLVCGEKLQQLGRDAEAEAEYRSVLTPRNVDAASTSHYTTKALRSVVEILQAQGRIADVDGLCLQVMEEHPQTRLADEARRLRNQKKRGDISPNPAR